MTSIDEPWLTQADTQRLFDVLTSRGDAAYAVGGCVRNAFLGEPVSDVDIATSATPEDVVAAASGAGLKVIPTGIEHGTVTVVSGDTAFEVTTFRKDIETDGRHATVAFTKNIAEDARRRDFSMNALYVDRHGKLVDPLGGLSDLLERRVRFIENPSDRIKEDYLRILRFFRFLAQYGDPADGLDQDALAAIALHLDGLDRLAPERIGAEMRKLLAVRNPAPSVAAMQSTGVLGRVLPGANPVWLGPLVHLEQEAARAPCAIRRLAILGGDDPTDALRLSKSEARLRERQIEVASSAMGLQEIAWRYGGELAWDVLLLRQAMAGQPLPSGASEMISAAEGLICPVTARDLLNDFQGAALGDALRRAEAAWVQSGFTLGRKAVLKAAVKEG